MKLKPGQLAPDFVMRDIYGRDVVLSRYAGRKTLISFHRAAVCPLCNLRLWHMIERYPRYQRQGLEIVAFFESSVDVAHAWLDRMRPPFPLIADRERTVYARYGLESSFLGLLYARLTRGNMYREAARLRIGGNALQAVLQVDGRLSRLPADFLVGPDLRVRRAYYGRDAGDFMMFSEIDSFIAARYGS